MKNLPDKPGISLKIIIFTLLLFASFIFINYTHAASPPEIYYQGDEVTEELAPVMENGYSLVRARSLAELINAELEWEPSLETIDLERQDSLVRMMIGSPYIQADRSTRETPAPPQLIEETGYIPLAEVVSSFGYLLERQVSAPGEESLYIYKPESELHEIYWSANERRLVFDMDEITPYRVKESEEPGELKIEIDKVSLADNFIDNASNRNFNVRVNENPEKSRLQVSISGPEELPYRRDGGVREEGENLVMDFLPQLVDISWDEQQLEIQANDVIDDPEVTMLEDPRRLVVDIPGLMLSDVDMELPENQYIEDVRISQFESDPAVLRVVMDLKNEAYLGRSETERDDRLVFQPTERATVKELAYEEGGISFVTSSDIRPEIFTLTDPARLVVNLLHTQAADDIPEEEEIDNELMTRLRSSQFDENIWRLVADLTAVTGYNWDSQPLGDGDYLHEIDFANDLREIELVEQPGSYNVEIDLSGEVDYEVTKFSNPARLAVDIYNLDDGEDEVELPVLKGFVEDIRMGRFGQEGEEDVLRIVLEFSEFHGYQVHSSDRTERITLAVDRDIEDRQDNLIVIDPGHGGFDPGAVADRGLTEKEVALDISKVMSEQLQEKGYDVILTRRGDQFVSLRDRVEIANNTNASLFVSVHSNAAHRNSVRGLETYHAPGRAGDSYELASQLQKTMAAELPLVDRGVKVDNFTVIRDTEMPSALLEIGFLSNPEDARLLADSEFRREAAQAAVEGIDNYFNSAREGVE